MLTNVILHGRLGDEFGSQWTFDLVTPREAMAALDANRSGFLQRVVELGEQGVAYRLLVDDVDLTREELDGPIGRDKSLHIVPVMRGAGTGFEAFLAFEIIAGVTVKAVLVNIAISLVMSGIASLLSKTPDVQTGGGSAAETKESSYFSGVENTTGQGRAVPLAYGEIICGSHAVSAGISTENL